MIFFLFLLLKLIWMKLSLSRKKNSNPPSHIILFYCENIIPEAVGNLLRYFDRSREKPVRGRARESGGESVCLRQPITVKNTNYGRSGEEKNPRYGSTRPRQSVDDA